MTLLAIAGGLALLALGGELLVRGASRLAARFGISPLVIGLTVVAFGTSAPELAVSLQAVQEGASSLAVGNVIGSNIFNTLFILGVSALIAPLIVSRRVIWVEVPVVIAVSVLAWVCAVDGRVGRGDGIVLLLVIAVYLGWLLRATSTGPQPPSDPPSSRAAAQGTTTAVVMAVVGLGLLLLGARWLVQGAVTLAQAFGVSDVIIGLTVVAAGTSLPEVAASVVATARGERDLAVGNVLGSSLFNLTVILGTTAVVADGLAVVSGVVSFDMVVMVAASLACLPIFLTGHTIARWEGGLFVGYYLAYTIYLILDAADHEHLPRYRDAMVLFALPLTAVTLVVLSSRALLRRRQRDP